MTERRKAKMLTDAERKEAKELRKAGLSFHDIARHFNVKGTGLPSVLGEFHPPPNRFTWMKRHANGTDDSITQLKSGSVVPELTVDFFNWMAHELIQTRQELQRVRADLTQYQQVKVSNELATIYSEYTRR